MFPAADERAAGIIPMASRCVSGGHDPHTRRYTPHTRHVGNPNRGIRGKKCVPVSSGSADTDPLLPADRSGKQVDFCPASFVTLCCFQSIEGRSARFMWITNQTPVKKQVLKIINCVPLQRFCSHPFLSHPSGPGGLCGLHPGQAAELQAAPLPSALRVHLQHQVLRDAQEHLPPPAAAAPPLRTLSIFFSIG